MSIAAYLTMTGAKQGAFKGGVAAKGREGTIALTAFESQIETPIDPVSGAATGKRQHQPIVITKLTDQVTPMLYEALVTNEMLTEVTIAFWAAAPDGSGTQTPYFTIKLTNAMVSGVTLISPDAKDLTPATVSSYEEVQLIYQTITWTWTNSNITAQDNWAA
jgi:type VI secretion system secreted protein Hcp